MGNIQLATGRELAGNKRVLNGMFGLRHQVFHERLGWDVNSQSGLEVDSFDALDPTYMVAEEGKSIEGCWRILPTTGLYMLKDTFPQLLRGEEAPQDPRIWEVSRFAISQAQAVDRGVAGVNLLTVEMFLEVVALAERNNVQAYVTVITVSFERLLKKIGMPMRRFGDGRAQRVGKVLSVAVWIDVNEQLRDCFVVARDSARTFSKVA